MSLYVECIEPNVVPLRRSFDIRPGEELAVYLLPGTPGELDGLRRTVLRPQNQYPPLGSRLLMWLQADWQGITITQVASGLKFELIRGDLRSTVVMGMRLAEAAHFELTMPDRSRVNFTLVVANTISQGAAKGMMSSGKRTSRVLYGSDNVFWMITDSKGIMVTFGVKIWNSIQDRLIKMGIEGRVIRFGTGVLLAGVAMGAVAYRNHRAKKKAEEAMEQAQDQAATAQAARDASLQTELQCLAAQAELAEELGKHKEVVRQAAKRVVEFSRAQGMAIERGARAFRDETVQSQDVAAQDVALDVIVDHVGAIEADVRPCLNQKVTAALGTDLPKYLVLWHSDPEQLCPDNTYTAVRDSVVVKGRWGLSDRVVRDFGEAGYLGIGSSPDQMGNLVEDPRAEDRWSAYTMAAGYRAILDAVLTTEVRARPPVLPSQAELWALAFFDAYNRMGSPAGGANDTSPAECVEDVIIRRAEEAPPAEPGAPVLPDIVAVAQGDVSFELTPDPGCIWPANAVVDGVDAAVRAAANMTAFELTRKSE